MKEGREVNKDKREEKAEEKQEEGIVNIKNPNLYVLHT